MSYATIQRPVRERAAAAVYGTVTGLILGGQDDAARYVVDGLDIDLLRDVHGLVDDRTDSALAAWLRERVNAGGTRASTKAVPAGPHPVVDPDADAPATMEEKVKRALRVMLQSATVREVTGSDAFGALVYRVGEACERDGVEPIVVFKRLGDRKLSMVSGMTNPATYLTKHVRDWEPGE